MITQHTIKLPLKITVLRKDIRRGGRYEPTTCPVAKAIRRAVGHDRVLVYRDDFFIGREKFIMPEEASSFIQRFDHSSTPHPRSLPAFTFMVTKRYRGELESVELELLDRLDY